MGFGRKTPEQSALLLGPSQGAHAVTMACHRGRWPWSPGWGGRAGVSPAGSLASSLPTVPASRPTLTEKGVILCVLDGRESTYMIWNSIPQKFVSSSYLFTYSIIYLHLYGLIAVCLFFLRFYLFIPERHRERGRDPGRGRSRVHAGSPMRNSIPGLRGHALSHRQTLYR